MVFSIPAARVTDADALPEVTAVVVESRVICTVAPVD